MAIETRPRTLLDHVYEDLDLINGNLLEATPEPDSDAARKHWRNLGDWLLLATRVDADRIFFVNDDPVLIFASLPAGKTEADVFDCYRRTWSMGRPRCLFLLVGNELRVYSLSTPPTAPDGGTAQLTPLAVVERAADVRQQLADFHRQRLELAAQSEGDIFSKQQGRADHQLISDIRAITHELANADLPYSTAHALIERVILIRYLEDRQIILPNYIDQIVSENSVAAIHDIPDDPQPNFGQPSRFIPLLRSKELTYTLFDELAREFNGDLFDSDDAEREIVTPEHLELLMDLLYGRSREGQQPLFLWAYDFNVVPTSLISTMYELFYHQTQGEAQADTYYTPPELVEFVLGDVLTDGMLDRDPRVLDPACGSGIFLVEAYRRIVRHETLRSEAPLTSSRLKELLLARIAGCDTDRAAIRLAAFSLYVAFLNYQSPQDIRLSGPLPPLIRSAEGDGSHAPLVVGNAFWPFSEEEIPEGGANADRPERLPWRKGAFQVVVGNPPWTRISGEKSLGEVWANRLDYSFGHRNHSQLFLWRSLHFLSEAGVGALLVNANAVLTAGPKSQAFRREWLQEVRVDNVINFSQVRSLFFNKSVAPFMLLRFSHKKAPPNHYVIYETARRSVHSGPGTPTLARLDRQIVLQRSLQQRDHLWKTYSAGGLRDEALMARLELEDRLENAWGTIAAFGYQHPHRRVGNKPSATLRELRSLSKFVSWGPLHNDWLEDVPPMITGEPDKRLLSGRRLLIRQGISPRFGPHARLTSEALAFRHTTYGISVDHLQPWQANVILGTLLSQLGRYWLYMVSRKWGLWKDTWQLRDLRNLPIRFTSSSDLRTAQIHRAVEQLYEIPINLPSPATRAAAIPPEIKPVLKEIDDGIANLFELTDAERELVADFWSGMEQGNQIVTLALHVDLPEKGTLSDAQRLGSNSIGPYLSVFVDIWNRRLEGVGEFTWSVRHDHETSTIAVIFEAEGFRNDRHRSRSESDTSDWLSVLRRLGLDWGAGQSQAILRHGVVRVMTDTAIVIVKRNEQHLWTATAGRQDADATAAQVMSMKHQ